MPSSIPPSAAKPGATAAVVSASAINVVFTIVIIRSPWNEALRGGALWLCHSPASQAAHSRTFVAGNLDVTGSRASVAGSHRTSRQRYFQRRGNKAARGREGEGQIRGE
jgi:hypothetical protein